MAMRYHNIEISHRDGISLIEYFFLYEITCNGYWNSFR